MFDSHCHLHDRRMADTYPEAIARAEAAGVTGFMLAGVDPEDWKRAVDVSREHPSCLVAYGIHPQRAAEVAAAEAELLFETFTHAARGDDGWPVPQALGEIGLDYMTAERKDASPLQEDLFRKQLAVAREVNLPIILHILRAHGRALEILEADGIPKRGGVAHSYSGSAELVPRYEALGLHISFAGTVCQPKAKRTLAAVQAVSLERLLVETDAPFQTPLPKQPGPNEPAYLPMIVEAVAEVREETTSTIANQCAKNARTLFG